MASRQMKMPVKDDAEKSPEAEDVFSQRRRPEGAGTCSRSTGKPRAHTRHRMPLNRRLWRSRRGIRSFRCRSTDAVENTNRIVEAPAAPEHVTSGGDAASAIKG